MDDQPSHLGNPTPNLRLSLPPKLTGQSSSSSASIAFFFFLICTRSQRAVSDLVTALNSVPYFHPTVAQGEESFAPLKSSTPTDGTSSSGVLVPDAQPAPAPRENDTSDIVSILNSFSRLTPTQQRALVPMLDNLAIPQRPAGLTEEGPPPSYPG